MRSEEIRARFLRFFEERGHLVMPSASLVPQGDPTLLLTTAGMVPFKPYFLGQATPPRRRLASCQKSFRTTDIESVGDATHLTFFEMLGNFSFGDYFKEGAIAFAWELLTTPQEQDGFGLDPGSLWATIYEDDDEAFRLWQSYLPKERIRRFGKEDNFWGPAGASGPCGPCSELHVDRGWKANSGRDSDALLADGACGPNCPCGRFLEIWNLVFMQYDQDREGRLTPLAQRNIDTGMGLERMAMLLQEKSSPYETDLFQPIVARVSELTGRDYATADEQTKRAIRIVAEHARAAATLIADGVIPSNERRGYVLRRVLRRAMRFGRKLGLDRPFLSALAETATAYLGEIYPELSRQRSFILRALEIEEERFSRTLEQGLALLEGLAIQFRAARAQRAWPIFRAEDFFRLHDTYGFPYDLIDEFWQERLGVPLPEGREGFERLMAEQRERSRAAARFAPGATPDTEAYAALGLPPTRFTGYETPSASSGQALRQESVVLALLAGGEPVERVEADPSTGSGRAVEVILRETPFYAEAGGQVGDQGTLRGPFDVAQGRPRGLFQVEDTQEPIEGLIVHRGRVLEGELAVGDLVTAAVDQEQRRDTMRNHTATHLLQAGLRAILGPHVLQAGSLVAPERLRFDFPHLGALTPDEQRAVEEWVNERIRANVPVRPRYLGYREALALGAIALFGEKYGEEVRLMEVGEEGADPSILPGKGSGIVSRELCGGTHVQRTGDIGHFLITSESSIGAGMRRIEAVTGRGAERYVRGRLDLLEQTAQALQGPVEGTPQRAAGLLAEVARERRRAEALEREEARRQAEALLADAQQVNGVTVVAAAVSAQNTEALKEMGDHLKARLGSGVVVLGTVQGGRPYLICMVTPDLMERGYHAGDLVRRVAQGVGGGGGGSATLGQAGGRDPSRLAEALAQVPRFLQEKPPSTPGPGGAT